MGQDKDREIKKEKCATTVALSLFLDSFSVKRTHIKCALRVSPIIKGQTVVAGRGPQISSLLLSWSAPKLRFPALRADQWQKREEIKLSPRPPSFSLSFPHLSLVPTFMFFQKYVYCGDREVGKEKKKEILYPYYGGLTFLFLLFFSLAGMTLSMASPPGLMKKEGKESATSFFNNL